jgi:hypothetical protein
MRRSAGHVGQETLLQQPAGRRSGSMSRLRKTCGFSPAKSGVRADQDEGAVLTGDPVDEALDLALR